MKQKNTITDIKNSLQGLKSRFELAEERNSELEDRLVMIMPDEEQREKRMKKNERSLKEMWVPLSIPTHSLMEVPAGEAKEEKIYSKK